GFRDIVSLCDRGAAAAAAEYRKARRRHLRSKLCIVRRGDDPLPVVRATRARRHLASRAELFPALALQVSATGGSAQMSETLLQVDKVEVVYQRVITAVQGISLSVGRKQIVAILGT